MSALTGKTVDGFRFAVDADDFINYAVAYNGKPAIRSLIIQAPTASPTLNATVEIVISALGQPLTQVWSAQIATLGQTAIDFEDINLEFYSDLLFQQTETVPAELKITIKDGDHVLTQAIWNLNLFGPDTWLWSSSSNEILAAYVQPNHPVLRQVLDSAVQILKSRGGETKLPGYQIPPHVRPMVSAIYQALVDEKITYSDPPAGWDLVVNGRLEGQRVRNAQTVLDEKVATCLDSAVLLASLLENVGLSPVIALIPGHAFVGYWTAKIASTEANIPNWTEMPFVEIMNAIDSGYLELFETTSICIGDQQLNFEEAITYSYGIISSKVGLNAEAERSTLINIAGCRFMAPRPIRPMPAKYVKPDGTIEIQEFKPLEFSTGMLRDRLAAEGAQGTSASALELKVPPVVKTWLNSLLDLSLRNPLIQFRERKNCIPLLAVPDMLGILEDLLQNNATLTIVPSLWVKKTKDGKEANILDDRGQFAVGQEQSTYVKEALSKKIIVTKYSVEKHQSKLREMASSAKTFQEETGSNGLYLALGTLAWLDYTGPLVRQIRSPLILVPVNLTAKNRNKEFYLTIDEGSSVVPNFSLAEKLFRDEGIKLDNLIKLQEDESGIDVDATFEYIRQKIVESGLQNCRVDEDAVLGFFDFSTYRMWRDLLDNWEQFQQNSLVNHFINSTKADFIDPSTETVNEDLDVLVSKLPIASDASQAKAISRAMAGKSFILQGPPGTGKSQTITNLLAKALSEGKRVLFVAQKKDALDVVKNRLEAAGLGVFSLDLFDKGMNPKVVKEELQRVIDIAISADKVGYSTAMNEYDNSLVPLQKYRDRLHEKGRLGESIYSALDKKTALQNTASLPIPGEFMVDSTITSKDSLYASAKTLSELGPQAGTATYNPWSITNNVTDFTPVELEEIKTLVRSMRDLLAETKSDPVISDFVANLVDVKTLELTKVLTYKEFDSILLSGLKTQESKVALRNSIESLVKLKQGIEKIPFDTKNLKSLDIDDTKSKTKLAQASFFLTRKLKIKKIFKNISQVLEVPPFKDTSNLLQLLDILDSIKKQKNQADKDLSQIQGIRFSEEENLFDLALLNEVSKRLNKVQDISLFLSSNDVSIQTAEFFQSNLETKSLKSLIFLGSQTMELFARLEANERSIELWRGTNNFGTRFNECIPLWSTDASEYDFSQLGRWIVLLREGAIFREFNLHEALYKILSGEVNYTDAPNAFLNGYFDALLQFLNVERGFNTFESVTINSHVTKLEAAHQQLRDRLPRITGAELLARRGFDSTMRVGAIGDLLSAIKQSKNRVPIRTLLAKNWSIISRVTPCVLASPDSCIRFLDPSLEPFDLVVFDEASQIRVAHAIGAIGRSKAVIVVGDSKQMPPTSVAEIRISDAEDDDEDQNEDTILTQDSESILDYCVNVRVPDVMLNWHYRSEDESLIAFSNKKYYKGKLNTFPSPSTDKSFKGLSFKYIEGGRFFRKENSIQGAKGIVGTNPIEADAIIDFIAKRLKDETTKNDSIGIVTFNQAQMNIIESKLAQSTDPDIQRAWDEGVGSESIFVKSLETVQGSERDVILFSVAFSANLNGDLPLNFGPLNKIGGERRLNVAVTRARKQVVVFCSFQPDVLVNRNPTSVGVLHLSQYLKLANKENVEFDGIYSKQEDQPDRIRKQILNALKAAGLNAVEEIGLSDFKVDIAIYQPKDSTKAILGILLDGPRWNSRETVSDRDCLSINLLRDRMGWPAIERIWLASWLRNPADEVQRIIEAYEKALSNPKQETKKKRSVTTEPIYTALAADDLAMGENPIDRLLAEVDEWRPCKSEVIGEKKYLDYLENDRIRKKVQEIVEILVKIEGPVSADRLAKFVGSCFGFDRVVSSRVFEINSIPFPGQVRDKEGFLYPKGVAVKSFTLWRRGTDRALRNISDISLGEIANAMKAICAVAEGIRPEQLNKEVSRLFGVQKVSASINDRLVAAVSLGIADGKLIKSGDYIKAAD